MSVKRKLKTAAGVLAKHGIGGVKARVRRNFRASAYQRSYREWVKTYGTINEAENASIRARILQMKHQPLISVILPVYNIDEKWLRICLRSVQTQIYENWQLCIADDKSTASHVRKVLDEFAAADQRINIIYRMENGHISAASNTALEMATGEFCVLLDHDDELSPDALFYVADEIVRNPSTAMIYSDEDMINERGHRYSGNFKPDFSRDLLYSLNLVTHLSAYRTNVLNTIGGFRIGLEGSQDYDLALRVIEQIDESQIRHIPRVLYHWRAIPGSVALSGDEKPYAHERGRQAIRDHLERTGVDADVIEAPLQLHHVRYRLPKTDVSVALVLHGRNAAQAPYSRLSATGITFTVVAVDETVDRLNEAVIGSGCDVAILLDAALDSPSGDVISELVAAAWQPKIGAVGGKVLDRSSTVVDGALVLGPGQTVSVANLGLHTDDPGPHGRNIMIGNFSAVSLSCMAVKVSDFELVGGFDGRYAVGLADVDLCLRLQKRGLRIVFNPFCELRIAKGRSIEVRTFTTANEAEFRARWEAVVENDPFYNQNFDSSDGQFRIRLS